MAWCFHLSLQALLKFEVDGITRSTFQRHSDQIPRNMYDSQDVSAIIEIGEKSRDQEKDRKKDLGEISAKMKKAKDINPNQTPSIPVIKPRHYYSHYVICLNSGTE